MTRHVIATILQDMTQQISFAIVQ